MNPASPLFNERKQMQYRRITLAIMVGLMMTSLASAQELGSDADKDAIRDAIVGYVKAINAGDASAAASFWSNDGVWIDPEGKEVIGSAEIEKFLAAAFEAGLMPKIELLDVNVRFIAPGVATEEGNVVLMRPGLPPEKSTYISIHTRTDSGWKLSSVRQTVMPAPASNYPHLAELEWMIGNWIDRDGDVSVETNCEWTTNRNFMLRTFRAVNADVVEMEGTQIVGWDALNNQIRSWVFDSDGGFGHGTWKRDGATWTIDAEFQNSEGQKGSSVNRFKWIDDDTFSWQSTGRMLNGEKLPDVGPFTVKKVRESGESIKEEAEK
jgi:uncharacterized protein (TIGR02246 family)